MATKEEVKLFGVVGSPFVTRVEVALKLKGVEYEYMHETWTTKSDLLLKYNPVHKKVPVLVHNEKPVSESVVIIEYVDEAWNANGYSILPSHPYQRALARFWTKFLDDKVVPTLFKAAFNPEKTEREKATEESVTNLEILEKELKGKFFNGESVGMVDILGLFIAYWVPTIQEAGEYLKDFNSEKFPKLHKWSEDLVNHPVVKQALPSRDYLVSLAKTKFESLAASK